MDVLAVINNVAEIDADAELERAISESLLHGDAAFNCLMDGRKLREKSITGKLNDTA